MGLQFLYNFSDDVLNAFYVGFIIGSSRSESETRNENDPSQNEKSEAEGGQTGLVFGKRFQIEAVGNFSYAPTLAFYTVDFEGEQFREYGIEEGRVTEIEFIKFDMMF